MPQERINTNHLRVTRDESCELCLHHLRLAWLFFESGPDDINQFLEEANRLFRSASPLEAEEPLADAARDFLLSLQASYDRMKADD